MKQIVRKKGIVPEKEYRIVQKAFIPWLGVVLEKTTFPYKRRWFDGTEKWVQETELVVLVIRDRNGKIPRKRILLSVPPGWAHKSTIPLDLSDINSDWLDLSNVPRQEDGRIFKKPNRNWQLERKYKPYR